MRRPFLTAEWRHLALFNYAVDPMLLGPYIPAGTQLDLWKGTCYLSLVGFLFKDTKLRGLPIPLHRNFEEVNLRFYVLREEAGVVKRGVVFIQEIVPRPALTWVARELYGEPYRTLPMEHEVELRPERNTLRVRYGWTCAGRRHAIEVTGRLEPRELEPGSEAAFITEHYWGYTKQPDGGTNAYEVKHPPWRVHPVEQAQAQVDFGQVYGPRFAFLTEAPPRSVVLAEGSAVQVMPGRRLPFTG